MEHKGVSKVYFGLGGIKASLGLHKYIFIKSGENFKINSFTFPFGLIAFTGISLVMKA